MIEFFATPTAVIEPPCCFVAGTRVHTDKGLVPIQDLKVGDMVLSKPENGEGELTYKRVIKTFVRKKQPIWGMVISARVRGDGTQEDDWKYEFILTTAGHPFRKTGSYDYGKSEYIKKAEWVIVSQLNNGAPLSGCKYENHEVLENIALYRTVNPNEAFYCMFRDCSSGYLLNIDKYKQGKNIVPDYFVSDYASLDDSLETHNFDEHDDFIYDYYLDDVYNIEVEDYHTYFAGELGVWVHNTCSPNQLTNTN